jgi:hypothetical protein
VDQLVAPERRAAIEAAFSAVGGSLMKPVFETLGGVYDYGEIMIVRAGLNRPQAQKPSGL